MTGVNESAKLGGRRIEGTRMKKKVGHVRSAFVTVNEIQNALQNPFLGVHYRYRQYRGVPRRG